MSSLPKCCSQHFYRRSQSIISSRLFPIDRKGGTKTYWSLIFLERQTNMIASRLFLHPGNVTEKTIPGWPLSFSKEICSLIRIKGCLTLFVSICFLTKFLRLFCHRRPAVLMSVTLSNQSSPLETLIDTFSHKGKCEISVSYARRQTQHEPRYE